MRIKLSLWEMTPLPEFPRSSLNVAMGSLQSAELGLFINLLYSLKSSLRINTKIGLSNFSLVRLGKGKKQKRNPLGKACRIWPRHDPSLGITLRPVLAHINSYITFPSNYLCTAWASRIKSLNLG